MKKYHISNIFGLEVSGHADLDFVDVAINADTKLFIDPCFIETSKDLFSIRCQEVIQDYFDSLYKAYRISSYNPYILSHLGERNETRFGYGTGTNGKAKTPEGMGETLNGLHDLIIRGVTLHGMIDIPLMMPRFAEDCMSDMLVNILFKQLSEFTLMQCDRYGIATRHITDLRYYWNHHTHEWCIYEGRSLVINGSIILLVPKKYVCTRFYYSTSQFFMSKIATMLQKDRTEVVNRKTIVPTKLDIRKNELKACGSLIDAVRVHTQNMPLLLSDYHRNMGSAYANRAMKDTELDWLVYGSINKNTSA